jgi:light-regulated signal transduction histidine kinase (bacteriophytochrome)
LPTYITFYPAIMVAALLGGIGPGLLATGLSALVATLLILEPLGILRVDVPEDLIALLLFCGMGVFMTVVAEWNRRSRAKAAELAREQALRVACQQAEEALRQANVELKRSNEELERFAYVASHDLQEPLRNVANYAELLRQRYQGQMDATADRYIGYVVGGASRMSELIADLLAFSRVSSSREPFAAISMEAALEQAKANLEWAINQSNATIESDPLPEVQGDRAQLVQLLQNLLSNAIKFRSREAPNIRIKAGRMQGAADGGCSGPCWLISVSDNGIGIDPKYHAQIFELFKRLHRQEEYPGTGIGLAVCRRIVERHGGALTVNSTPGRGATFSFTLPA